MNFKKDWSLVLGISIPILMILAVLASIYIPNALVQPKYDFIYSNGYASYPASGIGCPTLGAQSGKIVEVPAQPVPTPIPPQPLGAPAYKPACPNLDQQLYYHDTAANRDTQLDFAQASTYSIDQNPQSPDGFTVVHGSDGGDFLFGGGNNYETMYIKGHGYSKKLNLNTGSPYNFQFMGWVNK